jgi:potassium efflux system protein
VLNIGVAYGSDVDEVSRLLEKIAQEQPEVLKDPPPSVIFMEHGDSALIFALRVSLPSPNELMPLRDRLNKPINKEFAARGIEIPFPQRDLHVRGGPDPWSRTAARADDGGQAIAE